MNSAGNVVLGATVAIAVVAAFGLRSLGFQRKHRAAVVLCLFLAGILRQSFVLPFQMEDWWIWWGASLLSLLIIAAAGAKWLRTPYYRSVLDVCALGALSASFLDFFSWSLLGQMTGVSPEALVIALFAYLALGAFVLNEFRRTQQLQRPAGLVMGEILVTSGVLCAIIRFAADRRIDPVALGSALAGGALIAWLVPAFLREKEEHRIVRKQLEIGEAIEPEYTGPSEECPEPHRWSMYDSMTAEVEVLDLLRSLVRALKPKLVVETGTFTGFSSLVIAEGLRENGFGRLITCEFDQTVFNRAQARFEASPLRSYIDCRRSSSLEIQVEEPIDLLFCDSDLDIREQEVRHFLDRVNPYGLILMHDAGSRFRVVREAAFRLESEGLLSVVTVSTPRGLVIAQKREGRR